MLAAISCLLSAEKSRLKIALLTKFWGIEILAKTPSSPANLVDSARRLLVPSSKKSTRTWIFWFPACASEPLKLATEKINTTGNNAVNSFLTLFSP